MAVTDSILRSNEGPGFRFSDNVVVTEFSNVQSTGNGESGVVAPLSGGALGTGLNLLGNTQDGLRIINGSVKSAATWPALNVPYLFDRIQVDAPLTVSPGAAFVADGGGVIQVNENGALIAAGSAALPITFVGGQSITGHWDGLLFRFTNNSLNVLDFVTVSNGGGGGASTSSGNITLTCTQSSPVQVAISNSIVSNSAGFGIYRTSANCVVNGNTNNTYSGNVQGEINLP